MDTTHPKIGTLLGAALKMPWYMFLIGMTAFSKALKWMKLPERKRQRTQHRLNQTGASEQVTQQMA